MSAKKSEKDHANCPMDGILRLLMGPWTTYIIWLLETEGALRFGELKARMPRISSKMLTERLRLLEGAKIVDRDYRPTIPPTVSYSLTTRGHELRCVLEQLNGVASKWAEEDAVAKNSAAVKSVGEPAPAVVAGE